MQWTLENLVVGEIFAVMLVFCRIGSAVMLMPGISESYVSARVRLLFALTLSYLIAPVLKPGLPVAPSSPLTLFVLMASEVGIGFFLGMITKILIAALHTAGMVIASQSGLAAAMMFDASQGGQSASIGVFLTLVGTLVILTMGLHYTMLAAFADSYEVFKPGNAPPIQDMARYIVHVTGESFDLGIRLGAPIIAVGLFINLGAGILNRLMPQMPVFFVIMPLQLGLCFAVLAASIGGIMLIYSTHVEETLMRFLNP